MDNDDEDDVEVEEEDDVDDTNLASKLLYISIRKPVWTPNNIPTHGNLLNSLLVPKELWWRKLWSDILINTIYRKTKEKNFAYKKNYFITDDIVNIFITL